MLVPNWRAVLRRAWSIRLLILAGVLSGVEVALPLIGFEAIPAGTVTALRYHTTVNAVVFTAGGGANYFPGTSAGYSDTGGQYA